MFGLNIKKLEFGKNISQNSSKMLISSGSIYFYFYITLFSEKGNFFGKDLKGKKQKGE